MLYYSSIQGTKLHYTNRREIGRVNRCYRVRVGGCQVTKTLSTQGSRSCTCANSKRVVEDKSQETLFKGCWQKISGSLFTFSLRNEETSRLLLEFSPSVRLEETVEWPKKFFSGSLSSAATGFTIISFPTWLRRTGRGELKSRTLKKGTLYL